MPETPFDSVESAHEYLRLLEDAIDEARNHIQDDIRVAGESAELERRLQALRLVDYKLTQLRAHVGGASRLLNDLRTLRRLLLAERKDGVSGP